jgi:hypothetical protein
LLSEAARTAVAICGALRPFGLEDEYERLADLPIGSCCTPKGPPVMLPGTRNLDTLRCSELLPEEHGFKAAAVRFTVSGLWENV